MLQVGSWILPILQVICDPLWDTGECLLEFAGVLATSLGECRAPSTPSSQRFGDVLHQFTSVKPAVDQVFGYRRKQNRFAAAAYRGENCNAARVALAEPVAQRAKRIDVYILKDRGQHGNVVDNQHPLEMMEQADISQFFTEPV